VGQQLGLELWSRTYDLPPRWDGERVVWGRWDDLGQVFICPPPRKPDRCQTCGSSRPRLLCVGRIQARTPAAADNGADHPAGLLSALRCPDCGQDCVVDGAGQEWLLDDTDYGEDGSFDIKSQRGRRSRDAWQDLK